MDCTLAAGSLVWDLLGFGAAIREPEMHRRQICILLVVSATFYAQWSGLSCAAGAQRYRADEWVTECDPGPSVRAAECSITVPFWQAQHQSRGSFALVVMLQTANMGIVGEPFPTRAVLRVDKNLPIECKQARYCVFPSSQAFAALEQLKTGSLILIDVYTVKGLFKFSLTPKGFQAGIAQIHAWGYRTE